MSSQKVRVDIVGDNRKLKSSVKDSEKSLNSFGESIKKVGVMIGATFAVGQLKNFVGSALEAYNVQAQAENQLLVALKGREDAQKRLIAQAQALQRTTLFGDEETIRAQALIAAFVKEEDQIRTIIPLVQDLAAAKNMDLAGAADLVSKTLGSTTNALSRYGIEVEGTVGSTERLQSLSNGLSNAFGGQAEAAAKAGTGGLTQFKNIMGDLTEEVGYAIVELADMNTKLGKFSTIIAGIDIKKTVDEYTGWRKENEKTNKVLTSLLSPLKAINNYNKFIIDTGKGVAERFGWVKDESFELNYELNSIEENLKGINTAGTQTVKTADDVAQSFEEWKKVNAELRANREAKEALNDVDIGLKNSLTETLGVLGGTHEEFVAATGAAEGLTDGMFDLGLSLDENEERISEPGVDNLIAKYNQASEASDNFGGHIQALNDQITSLAASVAGDLAFAFGEAAGGMDGFGNKIAQIGVMIASALGDILIMAGVGMGFPAGVPFILAGLALKVIGGIASAKMDSGGGGGFGNVGFAGVRSGGGGGSVGGSSMLYGNDIRTSYDYAAKMQNRVG